MRNTETPDILREHGPMTAEELSEATDSTKASCKGSLRLAYQKGLIERRYCVAVDVVAGTYEYYVEEGK